MLFNSDEMAKSHKLAVGKPPFQPEHGLVVQADDQRELGLYASESLHKGAEWGEIQGIQLTPEQMLLAIDLDSQFILKVDNSVFIDAQDPRTATKDRWVRCTDSKEVANCRYVIRKKKGYLQLTRDVPKGTELLRMPSKNHTRQTVDPRPEVAFTSATEMMNISGEAYSLPEWNQFRMAHWRQQEHLHELQLQLKNPRLCRQYKGTTSVISPTSLDTATFTSRDRDESTPPRKRPREVTQKKEWNSPRKRNYRSSGDLNKISEMDENPVINNLSKS